MGSILGSCAGAMFAGLCCGACQQCSGNKHGVISRLPYIFLFFLAGIFAVVMSLYGEKELNLSFYSAKVCNNDTCRGNGSVYRVSFCLFAFELLHCLIIGCGAVSFHWLWFAIKFIVFVIGLTLTFILGVEDGSSNAFFDGYADYFARYVSALYLLIQILILISWAYKCNDYLQEKGNEAAAPNSEDQDEDETSHKCNCYFWSLGLSTLLLFAASFTLCGLFFRWYGNVASSECTTQRTFISITIVICIVNGVLSGVRGDGSFFVSSVVSFYCTFLCFAALQADDDATCNIWAEHRDSASLWIGYLITFLAIFYAAVRADQIGILWEDTHEDADMSQPLLSEDDKRRKDVEKGDDEIVADSNYNDVDDEKKGKEDEKSQEEPSKQVQKISNVYFHFVMMLAASYMAMLFSNWGTGTELKTTGTASMWVNIVSQYATAALFWWTLVAPLICPARFRVDSESVYSVRN